MRKLLIGALALLFLTAGKADRKPVIYIAGDSTAANKLEKAYPETGWGMELSAFFNDRVIIDNRAMNGRSTKSFKNEGRWDAMLKNLHRGDVVMIEFGHNDEKIDKPGVGTTLAEFKANLIGFVKDVKRKHAQPILLTPIARRYFEKGVLTETHGQYPAVTKQVADSLHVPLVDMLQKTATLLSNMGDEPSKTLFNYVQVGHANYPDGKKDDTHLNPKGAFEVARLVADGLKELKLNIAKYLK